MDVIELVTPLEKTDKHNGILKCIEKVSGKLSMINEPKQALTINHSSLIIERTQFLGNMFTYFRNAISNSQPAKEHVKNRSLDIAKIEVGYNSGQFHQIVLK